MLFSSILAVPFILTLQIICKDIVYIIIILYRWGLFRFICLVVSLHLRFFFWSNLFFPDIYSLEFLSVMVYWWQIIFVFFFRKIFVKVICWACISMLIVPYILALWKYFFTINITVGKCLLLVYKSFASDLFFLSGCF